MSNGQTINHTNNRKDKVNTPILTDGFNKFYK